MHERTGDYIVKVLDHWKKGLLGSFLFWLVSLFLGVLNQRARMFVTAFLILTFLLIATYRVWNEERLARVSAPYQDILTELEQARRSTRELVATFESFQWMGSNYPKSPKGVYIMKDDWMTQDLNYAEVQCRSIQQELTRIKDRSDSLGVALDFEVHLAKLEQRIIDCQDEVQKRLEALES